MFTQLMMAITLGFMTYGIYLSLRYVHTLKQGLALSNTPEISKRLTQQTFIVYNHKANLDYIIWKHIWTPLLGAATLHLGWVWWTLTQQAEISNMYMLVTVGLTSGILTRLITKNFASKWAVIWFNQLAATYDIVIMEKIQSRVAEIAEFLIEVDEEDSGVSEDEVHAYKHELTELVKLSVQINKRQARRAMSQAQH